MRGPLIKYLVFIACAAAHPAQAMVSVKQTQASLTRPEPQRLKELSSQGLAGYKNLSYLAFASDQTLETQWRALAAMSILGGPLSLPQLERAAAHSRWYLRSAALVGMSRVSPPRAIFWARKLLTDRALIVRSSAVETLRALHDRQSVPDLWREIYHQRNFKAGQSLWIRKNLAEAIAELSVPGDEAKLSGLLQDRDARLHPPVVRALQRLARASTQPNKS